MSSFINQFYINGVIDTSRPILENIEEICTAASCWMTWDPSAGRWSVVINAPGEITASFTDDNIVGPITVSSTSVDKQYNEMTVDFPNGDMLDTRDFVDISLDPNSTSIYYQRYENELDNRQQLSLDLVNNMPQALLIADRELKQSRLDKIIEFVTDYSMIGIQAGDLIEVTSTMYDFIKKPFRIITVEEEDADDGAINLRVTALEYDRGMYDPYNLVRKQRSKKTGIIPKAANAELTELDNQASITQFTGLGFPIAQSVNQIWSVSAATAAFGGGNIGRRLNLNDYSVGGGFYQGIKSFPYKLDFEFQSLRPIKTILINVNAAQGKINYTVDGSTKTADVGIPTLVSLFRNTTGYDGPWQLVAEKYMEWSTYSVSFNLVDVTQSPTYWYLMLTPLNTYDLNATDNYININSVNPVFAANMGGAADVSVNAFVL